MQKLVPLAAREEWDRELEGTPHAFAHTWASCRAMHLTTGWPTFLYSWRRGRARAVCALAERGEPGAVDVVTPYGFGGIVGVDVGPEMLEDWRHFALERDYVCGYLGLNPELAPRACLDAPDYAEHNDVYVLDLDRGLDVLLAALTRDCRRELRAFDAGPARLLRDRDRLAGYFLDNIDAFLASRTATATYAFAGATWRALLDSDDVLLLGVEEPGGAIASVYLFAWTAHCAEALFTTAGVAGRKYSTAMLWAGAVALTEKGIPRLNLGGGVRRGDGVAQFKEKFGAKRLPLGALRQVYRPDAYDSSCREVGADPTDRAGFFPAYRAPGTAGTSGARRRDGSTS